MNLSLRSAFALVLCLGCAACGKTEPLPPVEAGSGSAPSGPAGDGSPWSPSSVRLELTTYAFWTGSSGYAKDRADMTAEQLTALDGLRTMPTPKGALGFDGASWRIRVVDEAGSVATYRAAFANIRDSDESAEALELPTIDVETLKPFLATFQCLHAKEVPSIPRSSDAPLDPSTVDTSKASKLPADLGCINGVFVPYGCCDSVFTFDVASAATYELSTGRCIERLSLRVYASDRSTLVAEGSPGGDETCVNLRHALEPGSYLVVLGKTNAAGCGGDRPDASAAGGAGDVSLSIRVVK